MPSRGFAAAALAIAATGCSETPTAPTYVDDVRTILAANCVRCHAAPEACTPSERASFRLDHWGDVGDVRGVASMTERITLRAADSGTMPPSAPLTERAREILARWQRAGSPRGERLENQPPALSLFSDIPAIEPPDPVLRLDVDVSDPDGDAVVWEIGWERQGVVGTLVAQLGGGRSQPTIDLGVLASGSYQFVARLRDDVGDDAVEVVLGAPIQIAERNAAPGVHLLYPVGGERLGTASDIEVRWTADDADTPGALTAELLLLTSAEARVLVSGLDARSGIYLWSPVDVADGEYDLELRVSDGALVRSVRSACSFTVASSPP